MASLILPLLIAKVASHCAITPNLWSCRQRCESDIAMVRASKSKKGSARLTIPILPGAKVTAKEERAFACLRGVLGRGRQIETYISNPRRARDATTRTNEDQNTLRLIRRTSAKTALRCRKERARIPLVTSNKLSEHDVYEFASAFPLRAFDGLERYIPRIVNVVSVAIANPIPGKGTTLPLTNEAFQMIATRCTGAYYAPRRFSNIQLGFRQPRARVLVFQTGQLVTTGTTGIASTRLVVNLAIEQLAREAGVHLRVDHFAVKNIVASCSLDATFNCEGFSKENSGETNYDRSSFAGMVRISLTNDALYSTKMHHSPTTPPFSLSLSLAH